MHVHHLIVLERNLIVVHVQHLDVNLVAEYASFQDISGATFEFNDVVVLFR